MTRRLKLERVAIALALQQSAIAKPKDFARLDTEYRDACLLKAYRLLPFLARAGVVVRVSESFKR